MTKPMWFPGRAIVEPVTRSQEAPRRLCGASCAQKSIFQWEAPRSWGKVGDSFARKNQCTKKMPALDELLDNCVCLIAFDLRLFYHHSQSSFRICDVWAFFGICRLVFRLFLCWKRCKEVHRWIENKCKITTKAVILLLFSGSGLVSPRLTGKPAPHYGRRTRLAMTTPSVPGSVPGRVPPLAHLLARSRR